MITANFIHRIFRIACGDRTGTAFAIDVDGRRYIVTARHVIESFAGTAGTIEVFGNGSWQHVGVKLVAHGSGDVDISVLASAIPLCPSELPVVASSQGLVYGQDVYFLGFPYGVLSQLCFTEAGYPLPLVKKATMSAFAGDVYLLDGHNNVGFSGGPVIFRPGGQGQPTHIAGVVAEYISTREAVLHKDKETRLEYESNTGIIVVYKIELALAMIKANPIGLQIR